MLGYTVIITRRFSEKAQAKSLCDSLSLILGDGINNYEVVIQDDSRRRREELSKADRTFGGLRCNFASRSFFKPNGEKISLPPMAKTLLVKFFERPNHLFRRNELMDLLGVHEEADQRAVDTHLKRLKRSLEEQGFMGLAQMIQTERGIGYCFSPPSRSG